MPPPQQPAPTMELEKQTEDALAGQMEAHGKPDFLDPAICLVCTEHTFGEAVAVTSSCGHHFHPKCIEDAMRRNPEAGTECPCGAVLPPGREPVVDATRMHKQMMNGIKVECPQGCGGVMQFELIRGHVHNDGGCPNTPYRCGNAGCGALFLRKGKDAHLNICPHRLVSCELCEQPIKQDELLQHKAGQCPRRKVGCPHCEQEYVCCEKEQHMCNCTGRVSMRDMVELREMMAWLLQRQQQDTEQQVGLLRDRVARQERTITGLQQTNAQQQQTNAQQQQTIEQQQREIAELREVTRRLREEQQRRREEQEWEQQRLRAEQQRQEAERRERALLPQKLRVERNGIQTWIANDLSGEYSLRPERVNGAAVWGKDDCRIYRSREGHWGLTRKADGPQRNYGDFRLTSQPGSLSPVSEGGWEYNTKDSDMSRVDGWKPAALVRVRAP